MQRRWWLWSLLAVAAFLLVGRFAAAVYTDYLWFESLNNLEMWRIATANGLILSLSSFAVTATFLALNLYAVRASVVSLVLPRRIGNLEIGEEVPGRFLTRAAFFSAAAIALPLTFPANKWVLLASARFSVPFAESDPHLGHDISFFVNWLPFEEAMFSWASLLVAATIFVVLVLYALTPSLKWEKGRGPQLTLYVRRHIAVLTGCTLFILSWSMRLRSLESLTYGSGPEGMFTAVDRAMLGTAPLFAAVTMLVALLLVWAMWSDQIRLAFVSATVVLLVSVAFRWVAPVIVERSLPGENAAARNRAFLATHAGYTRRAFGVDDLSPALPAEDFMYPTLEQAGANFPLWDVSILGDAAAAQLSGGAQVVGRGLERSADGGVALLAVSSLVSDDSASLDRWAVVRAMTNAATASGAILPPDDRPSRQIFADIVVAEPSPGVLLVPDSGRRIPAPSITGRASRIAHAWSMQNPALLFSALPTPDARIIRHSSVHSRLNKLVPFLSQGTAIYPIVESDTLIWAVHLYSRSKEFPLSRSFPYTGADSAYRYIRHAATALVNSSTGRVRLFRTESPDPMLRGWLERLPELFLAPSEMPLAVARRLPPPVEFFAAQADAFARFGARGETLPDGSAPLGMLGAGGDTNGDITFVLLPGNERGIAWVQPILDSDDMIVRLHYAVGGESPRAYVVEMEDKRVSWREAAYQLDAQRDSLAANLDGRLLVGATRVIPAAGRILLARSSYSRSAAVAGTSFLAVSVADGGSVRTERTLRGALGVPFDGEMVALTPATFQARVQSLYEVMSAALRRGDLVAFGEAFAALGAAVAAVRR